MIRLQRITGRCLKDLLQAGELALCYRAGSSWCRCQGAGLPAPFYFKIAASSRFHWRSITNVPKGRMEAMNDLASQAQSLPVSLFTSKAITIKPTNKRPCNPPTILTAIGESARYFKGMAMKSNTKNEVPSARAIFLNQLKLLFPFIILLFCLSS